MQRHRLSPSSPPFPLFISLSLCLFLALSFLGCPNEMWASCRTMKRGSQGCFFTVPEPQCASFNLMFQCKLFFHKLPSPHVCNMAGFTLQPPCHYGYQGKPKCTVAKATFYYPFYLTMFAMVTFHVAPVKGTMVKRESAFHMCLLILSVLLSFFSDERIPHPKCKVMFETSRMRRG